MTELEVVDTYYTCPFCSDDGRFFRMGMVAHLAQDHDVDDPEQVADEECRVDLVRKKDAEGAIKAAQN